MNPAPVVDLLKEAINARTTFAFETTLGGQTISGLLLDALGAGLEVRIAYVGLAHPDIHVARVKRRVQQGGHDVPEARIRDRYDKGRENLIRLLPWVTELWLFDNTAEAAPDDANLPEPQLILHFAAKSIVDMCAFSDVPGWAKPIVFKALDASEWSPQPRS